MPYLIDGHNVIGRGRSLGLSLEDAAKEKRLLDLVARWRDRRKVREGVTVFFDGVAPPTRAPSRGVGVVHGGNRTADEAIADRVRRALRPRDLTVVTSDRAVAREVRVHGARVISSEEFLAEVAKQLDAGGREKPERPAPDEIAKWLSIFGDGE